MAILSLKRDIKLFRVNVISTSHWLQKVHWKKCSGPRQFLKVFAYPGWLTRNDFTIRMIVELSSNFRMKNFQILTAGPGRKYEALIHKVLIQMS
jgi:hypothetical protein